MKPTSARRVTRTVPLAASLALLLGACGSDNDHQATAAQQPAPAAAAPESITDAPAKKTVAAEAKTAGSTRTDTAKTAGSKPVVEPKAGAEPARSGRTKATAGSALTETEGGESAAEKETNRKLYDATNGATDIGVTKDGIRLGSINMHGMALGNLVTAPQVRGNLATVAALNDRGGVLGRRLSITDCDDGPGEVSRAKACIKKLVSQDKIFSLVTGVDWATGSIHDDLRQFKLPYIGAWAYSQTEWQDPYMFPTHMSMIHEAMAGAHWAKNVVKPKTYGLLCLTSPEMQLACNEVKKVLDASGAKMVKRADLSISETSMSSQVLAMRAANPEHIVHYVINPATIAKFMVESQQQGYYPSKGISGNHLASEVLGSIFGKWPMGRYWTNTTYRLWGSEFMATMNKYARSNKGANHHIVQAGYVGINIFARAAKQVGPNLTRERIMATLGNGTVWASDASLDQRFSYVRSERHGTNWSHDYGQGREFVYKFESINTTSNPDGTPNGWVADPDQHVIYTHK